MNKIRWSSKHFNELTVDEFHDIIKLRVDVFVVEQNCPYSEVDDLDRPSLHVTGFKENELIAYARIIPPTAEDPHVHVGRVIVKKDYRSSGIGHELMSRTMIETVDRFPKINVELAAQSLLTDYYEKHGFKIIGEEYLWDGIPHKDMLIKRSS